LAVAVFDVGDKGLGDSPSYQANGNMKPTEPTETAERTESTDPAGKLIS